MERRKRSSWAAGLALILLGAVLLVAQFVPAWREWVSGPNAWPVIILSIAAFLFILGVLVGEPGLAVPACIVGGIGALLYYQNYTGDWGSWAYAWTLIPGFVGVGVFVTGLFSRTGRGEALRGGLILIFISLVMFAVSGAFLGGPALLGQYWPVLLITLGLFLLVGAFLRPRR